MIITNKCILILFLYSFNLNFAKKNKNAIIDNIDDMKEFKKLLRTKTNILVCFTNNLKESSSNIKIYKEAAEIIKGQGTMVLIDCLNEAKKLCKKLKISNEAFILKHYYNGEYHKDYDRKISINSMVNFMRDPTGDLPWEEDQTASDVVHINNYETLVKYIKHESKPMMVMFYAPWCGFCKTLKPEYVAAATELKNYSVMAAIDVNKPENAVIRTKFNITGFPTLLYFKNGELQYIYEGANNKNDLVTFMKNPSKPVIPEKEPEWSEIDNEVVHLTTTNFDPVSKEEASLLVIFYAPWCGHCKKMKPEYEKAAAQLKSDQISGMMAAVDATRETDLTERFSIKGYPTIKYFQYGEFKFDVNIRDTLKIVEFMKDPKEPPPPPLPEKPWSEELSFVVHLTDDNYKSFLKRKKHVLIMFYAPWCGHCKRTKPEFIKAAEYFKDDPKVEFAAIDCTSYQTLCSINEVTGYPTIKYFNYLNKGVKNYNSGRTTKDFINYMKKFEDSSLSNEKITDIKILQLTDNSFKEIIETEKNVLVMFYAPWCKQCKEIKSEYGKIVNDITKIKLAMVDCSSNMALTEEFNISGFPTIKLFLNGKYFKDYSGRATIEDIRNFLKELMLNINKEL